MRIISAEPLDRASSQASNRLDALPMCKCPEGDGANRPCHGSKVHIFHLSSIGLLFQPLMSEFAAMKNQNFGTLAIHGGQEPDPSTGAVMPPIYQTSTYVQTSPGQHKGYEYSRTLNPTRHALGKALASIELGSHGLAFGSGLAAVDACMKLLKPGDEVISCSDLYGGTYRQFVKIYEPFGIQFHFVDMDSPEQVTSLVNERTAMIWAETPTNPMLNVIDIPAMATIAQAADALLVVDNTFATPYLQQPTDPWCRHCFAFGNQIPRGSQRCSAGRLGCEER